MEIREPDDLPWAAYAATVVTVEGEPAAVVAGERGTFHVITAWNPMSRPTPRAENERRHAALLGDVAEYATLGAVGRAPDGTHAETSVAVFGITRDQAIALGRRHEQAAIFEITPREQRVVSCLDGRPT